MFGFAMYERVSFIVHEGRREVFRNTDTESSQLGGTQRREDVWRCICQATEGTLDRAKDICLFR